MKNMQPASSKVCASFTAMILLFVIILLFIFYSILIFYYWQSWISIPVFHPGGPPPNTKISVIIPARNEEENIGKLLQALNEQTYKKELTQIIVVDDHSTDNTAPIAGQFPGTALLRLPDEKINSYKKKAIETGIAAATGEFIITTDADCIPGEQWLQTMVSFKQQTGAVFIVAPVRFTNDLSVLSVFQSLDFMVLQGITGASVYKNIHSMCNGANLGYERSAFSEVDGFKNIDTIASGDDMLLLYKIWKKYPGGIQYLKSNQAIVTTTPMKTWGAFFNQRIRWASKASKYDDKRILAVLLLVYLFNLSFLVLFIGAFFIPAYWTWLVGLVIAKIFIELPFITSIARFFNQRHLLKYFPFFQPLHIFYTILSGLFGQFGRYEWKGRKVK
jgi:poly-beta-1,6-N-acetyl-D-glucosamine synthase